MDTIKECKSLVTYFKHSSLNSKLGKSLKQEVETRWNSKLEMLESINKDDASITFSNPQYCGFLSRITHSNPQFRNSNHVIRITHKITNCSRSSDWISI
jgi:hypothetical protein